MKKIIVSTVLFSTATMFIFAAQEADAGGRRYPPQMRQFKTAQQQQAMVAKPALQQQMVAKPVPQFTQQDFKNLLLSKYVPIYEKQKAAGAPPDPAIVSEIYEITRQIPGGIGAIYFITEEFDNLIDMTKSEDQYTDQEKQAMRINDSLIEIATSIGEEFKKRVQAMFATEIANIIETKKNPYEFYKIPNLRKIGQYCRSEIEYGLVDYMIMYDNPTTPPTNLTFGDMQNLLRVAIDPCWK